MGYERIKEDRGEGSERMLGTMGQGGLSWVVHVEPSGAHLCLLYFWPHPDRSHRCILTSLISSEPLDSATSQRAKAAALYHVQAHRGIARQRVGQAGKNLGKAGGDRFGRGGEARQTDHEPGKE